ncbi:MAG: M20 family metallopeptidase [Geminicoccaceae bacterium]|nr:M20 family metallopeptidase [Geminicoccaceae bacterium]
MLDKEEMIAEIGRWVEIETPTTSPDRVDRLMELVETEFRTLGAHTRIIQGRDGYGNHLEVASPWGAEDQPGVLILSHLDTVHPIGTIDGRLKLRREGDRVFGPGIYDMKGGAYLALAAFRELVLQKKTTPLPLRWLITSDEEVGSPTSEALIVEAGRRAKYVLVTEPGRDGGKCVTARKGTARYTIRMKGCPAHSGARHHEGRSAIREMARQILDLEALTDYETGVTTNVGLVSGGTAVNTIPEEAVLHLDVRLPTVAAADEILPRIAATKSHDPDVTLTVEGGGDRPPYERTERTAALFAHARALAAEIGYDLGETFSGGGSDGNFLADRLPILDGIGVDGNGAHTYEEHLDASSLVPRATLILRLMETLD